MQDIINEFSWKQEKLSHNLSDSIQTQSIQLRHIWAQDYCNGETKILCCDKNTMQEEIRSHINPLNFRDINNPDKAWGFITMGDKLFFHAIL